MFIETVQYYKKLDDQLALKSVASMEDIERLMELHLIVFEDEPSVARLLKALILDHPYTKPDYFLFIEDETSKTIVSSISLIPWIINFKGIELRSAEFGLVGTLKEYRNRGLIHALNDRFCELLIQENFDMTQIEGIAYFYKQFGYEYAIPLEPNYILDLHLIPDQNNLTEDQQRFIFRRATMEDIPILMKFFDEMTRDLEVKALRSQEIWEYLLEPSLKFDPTREVWLTLDRNREPLGYFRVTQEGFGEGLIVNEVSTLPENMIPVVLNKIKDLCLECKRPYVRFNNHSDNIVVKKILALGAKDLGNYAWQIYFPDLVKFLKKIVPVLEERLASGNFAELNENLYLDIYRNSIEFKIVHGKITEINLVESKGEASHMRIPPNLLVPFLLGYRSRADLMQCHHDVSCLNEFEELIDVIFPKTNSFMYLNY